MKKQNIISIFLLLVIAVGIGYWIGFKSVQNTSFRPANLVKFRPSRKRIIKPLLVQKSSKKKEVENEAKNNINNSEDEDVNKTENLQDLDVNSLTLKLTSGLKNIEEASLEQINQNISIADALIAKDPEIYHAYKSKLINLLIKETRFGESVPIEDYEDLFAEMLTFEGVNQVDEIMGQLQEAGENEVNMTSSELIGIDQDLIHLPFLRFSALNELESLADISEEYIEVFPESYIGYLYLAEAFWQKGDRANAAKVLHQGLNIESNKQFILHLFSIYQMPAIDRIYKMSQQLHTQSD